MDYPNSIEGAEVEQNYELLGVTLGGRVRRGGVWVFSGRFIYRALSLVRLVVLARLLSPNDFGLFGIALLTLSLLDTFSQTGFREALIQKKGDTRSYLDTAWTVGIIRGISIAALLFAASPLAASFFNAAQAEPILKVIGLAIIVQSLSNIAIIYFEKELEFHKYFAYQLIGTIVDFTVAVTAALLLRSVWALVFGCLAGNFARCIVSYVIEPYRPRFRLDLVKAKELFIFGKWILGSSILIFLITQGDDIFVGKLLGTTMLGFYQMAYRISNMPATEISHVISKVSFPAYSKLKDNLPKLKEAYLKVLQLTAFLSFPIAGLIFVLAPDFTRIFLGEKWMPMVPAMMILVWWGVIRSMAGANSSILQAVKRPDIITKLNAIKLLILAILIYPFSIKWGILGTSLVVLISAIFITPNTFYIVICKVLRSKISVLFKALSVPFTGTVFMVFFLILFMPVNFSLMGFVLEVLVGIFCYLLITYIFDKVLKQKIWHNLKTVVIEVLK